MSNSYDISDEFKGGQSPSFGSYAAEMMRLPQMEKLLIYLSREGELLDPCFKMEEWDQDDSTANSKVNWEKD